MANEHTRDRCESLRADLDAAIVKAVGGPVKVMIVIDRSAADDDTAPAPAPASRPSASRTRDAAPPPPSAPPPPAASVVPAPTDVNDDANNLEDEDDIDLDELVDVPPEQVVTPTDRLLEAFPGSMMVQE